MLSTNVFTIYSISLKLTPVPVPGTGVSFNERTKKDYHNYLHHSQVCLHKNRMHRPDSGQIRLHERLLLSFA